MSGIQKGKQPLIDCILVWSVGEKETFEYLEANSMKNVVAGAVDNLDIVKTDGISLASIDISKGASQSKTQGAQQPVVNCDSVTLYDSNSYQESDYFNQFKESCNLGVLPPCFAPMLLNHYEREVCGDAGNGSTAHVHGQPTVDKPLISTEFYLTSAKSE